MQNVASMTPDELKLEISRQAGVMKSRPSLHMAVHPGGPDGSWSSVSLQEHDSLATWLHFRVEGDRMEHAFAVKMGIVDLLNWIPNQQSEIQELLREFVKKFGAPPCDRIPDRP